MRSTYTFSFLLWLLRALPVISLLPARASEQGNVIVSLRIYTKYSTLPRGISVYIEPKVGIFSEAEGQGKYSLPWGQYMPIFHKEGFWIFSLLHRIYSLWGNYCIRSDVPIDHAQNQGWNIGVEHRNIFHPYKPIWLVRFTRLCNKYI